MGDTGLTDEVKARFLSLAHVPKLPPWHIPSTTAKSDTARVVPRGPFDTNKLHEATLAGGEIPVRRADCGRRQRHGCSGDVSVSWPTLFGKFGQQAIEVTTKFFKSHAMSMGRCAKYVHAAQQGAFARFHKFTKLPAQSVAAHGRAIVAAQGISHLGRRERRIDKHRARQGSGAHMDSLLANPEED